MAGDTLHFYVWSEHFLGTEPRCRAFLSLLKTLDGARWMPEKWGHFEPIRSPFDTDSEKSIVNAWTEERPPGSGRSQNSILFRKSTPKMLADISTSRGHSPWLNWIAIDLAGKSFSGEDGPERLVRMATDLVGWSQGVYATVSHSRQVHRRPVGGSPLLRLANLSWLTFFGAPYVAMFRRERLLTAPCHDIREALGGVFLRATPRPDSPELTTSNELLRRLEEHLGREAFAGYGYPEKPCRVPTFDLSETIVPTSGNSNGDRLH